MGKSAVCVCVCDGAPTCVDAILQPHTLEVVVTPLLVLLKRAALFVTPPTVGTLVGFSNYKEKEYTDQSYVLFYIYIL